jgi:hypothetical protein
VIAAVSAQAVAGCVLPAGLGLGLGEGLAVTPVDVV